MGREIKFRAWDKDSKLMLYKEFYDHNWYTTPKNDEDGCHTYSSMQYSDQYHKELMQYTGLKDKNGKEIYEGDIVEFPVAGGDLVRQEVIFNRGAFATKSGRMWGFEPKTGYLGFYEVIGNIYENPELISPTPNGEGG